jgi:hydroxymethylpyrimidine pyrophosphatase-like HAD family hydrolase
MLTCAGTAIAMGQASADVKAAAHLVAPPVEEDGAAAAIRLALWHPTHPAAASPPRAHPGH